MSQKEVNEKIKPLVLTDNDTGDKYTLEFSRESVKFAEARGFDVGDVSKYPMTKIPELFFYAFRMHHKNIARERTDRMLFEDLGGLPSAALERLVMLYTAPFEALTDASENGEEKNSRMTVEM
jgi:hypothetical protein